MDNKYPMLSGSGGPSIGSAIMVPSYRHTACLLAGPFVHQAGGCYRSDASWCLLVEFAVANFAPGLQACRKLKDF